MKPSRRKLLQAAPLAAVPAAAPAAAAAVNPSDVYTAIGVKPIINARGTFTIISGSTMLPEARAAADAAAQRYVHIDELMDAAGAKLAQLTGAEWGLISCGCAAAITHATAACVAGGNPDLHVRIPDLKGFAKDEVIIPTHSRNVYDAAVRAVGVRVVEVSTPEELELAIGPRTAMIYILAGPGAERGPLAFEALVKIAKPHNVPILVDAAAEILTIPNVHLQRGATLVTYSGGKCIRGPQTAGLLLGRKDLIQAAWVHSAPHHGFARALKIGKEETIAMLTAVEMWTKRDHKAEWQKWLTWLRTIEGSLKGLSHLKLSINEPNELSNRTPALQIRWDDKITGWTGADMERILFSGEPRMATAIAGNGINIVAYMLQDGDAEKIGPRLKEALAAVRPPARKDEAQPAANLDGRWRVRIEFLAGSATHYFDIHDKGGALTGTHQGDFVSRGLRGTISGASVDFASSYAERHGDSLQYRFTGKLQSDGSLSGDLNMGEYRMAKWAAVKV
jgi:L-seryl-tRNA(Ser) seleniumtransferase